MNTSFITNTDGQTLKDRFKELIKDTDFFDCLVGYFYLSGFYAIYPNLEKTKKIRILIGIGTEKAVLDQIEKSRLLANIVSHGEAKQEIVKIVQDEMAGSEDSQRVEQGVRKFIEWLGNDKMEIRAYPAQNMHAKVYIMTFKEGDRDKGRVITGSSNFTKSGLEDNLEFNVELKKTDDYEFAKKKFDTLWKDSVEVTQEYIQTIQEKTWLKQVNPYELYLKFLYEYFKDQLNLTDHSLGKYLPQGFKELEYQKQAVLNAKRILLEYGGVFISDVVGLGKTYISAMLADQLDGRTLVIAPPVLLERTNPGSWPNVFMDFNVSADFESIGKLDALLTTGTERYTNIIIDEAHRLRTEDTQTYEKIARICRGKRVVLVTATPYNNRPHDILSLIKLFQNAKQSTIPNLPDLEYFFKRLEKRLQKLDRKEDHQKYIHTVRKNSREIRDKVLKYLMVRRTRTEIEKYFAKDLSKQGIRFPKVQKPVALFYQLNKKEQDAFNDTITALTEELQYARYTPLLYYNGTLPPGTAQSQVNMGRFMKILLVKRLESSFYAFRKSIDRFLESYNHFLNEIRKGNVYVSKRYIHKIFDLLERGDVAGVQRLIDEDKADRYDIKDFDTNLKKFVEQDLETLKIIKGLWQKITRDPKFLTLKKELTNNEAIKNSHMVIFTESKETAQYLAQKIENIFHGEVLLFTGDSNDSVRDQVIDNFDANAKNRKDQYRILISTEVLSEGVNLHRSNVVINYDIPWNPTRMMQRVGRVNRVDTPFDTIHTFNFFPTDQANDEIKLKEAAISKINAFLTLLGGDAELLTEGEPIGSHELFDRLTSQKSLEGDEEESGELKYLQVIRDIRENNPDLFSKIKHLPKKARTAKPHPEIQNALVTYFRKGKIQKFYLAKSQGEAQELDFPSAAALLESGSDDKSTELPGNMYDMLDKNKRAFSDATTLELQKPSQNRGSNNTAKLRKILKATLQNASRLTDDQEDYIKIVLKQLDAGALPKPTIKKVSKALKDLGNEIINPLKVLGVLQIQIPKEFIGGHYAHKSPSSSEKREVILSLYLTKD